MLKIDTLYDRRFPSAERIRKSELWKVLCEDFLQQFVSKSDLVVDLGAGNCEFINNIRCSEKIAIDINPDVFKFAEKNIKVIKAPIRKLKEVLKNNSADCIFMSNFLEHLNDKEEVFNVLHETYEILRPGGKLLIMQPDIKLVGNAYWDFFDHKVPITLESLSEGLHANGYSITHVKYPFLPYTTKTKYLPQSPLLLRIYLKVRPLQFLFGKQFFVCAGKN